MGWSSSLLHSSIYAQKVAASKYLLTIRELPKGGRKGKAGIKPPILSSNKSMSSLQLHSALSSRATYQVPIIQQTTLPEESTLPQTYCYPQFTFPSLSNPLLQTLTVPLSLLNSMCTVRELKQTHSPIITPVHESHVSTSITHSIVKEKSSSKWCKLSESAEAHITIFSLIRESSVAAYPADLIPQDSHLKPHCTAKDRLYLWLPATDKAPSSSLPHADV